MQIAYLQNRHNPVVVSFDVLNHSKKWSESEKNVLNMMGKIIAKHVYESEAESNRHNSLDTQKN